MPALDILHNPLNLGQQLMREALLEALVLCTNPDEPALLLVFHHQGYRFTPHMLRNKDPVERWPDDAVPIFEYFALATEDMRTGVFGDPHGKTLRVFGDCLMDYFRCRDVPGLERVPQDAP